MLIFFYLLQGITGDDERKYLLDLARILPVDIKFLEQVEKTDDEINAKFEAYPHKLAFIRPELLQQFVEYKATKYVKEAKAAFDAEKKSVEDAGGVFEGDWDTIVQGTLSFL